MMREARVGPPSCTPAGPDRLGDCGTEWAVLYFASFAILCQYAFLPLFVASFISNFFETVGQQTALTSDDLHIFTHVWESLDTRRSGVLPAWKLRVLLDRLLVEESKLAIDAGKKADRYAQLSTMLREGVHGTREIGFGDVAMGLCMLKSFDDYLPK